MSKAFTREDEGVPEPPLRAARPQGPRRPVTPEGHRALMEELLHIESGLSADEPPPARLGELRTLLDAVEKMEPQAVAASQVQFGSWVLLEDGEGGRVRWRIVGPDEADTRGHRLSIDSPLAKALLGKRAGEEFTFERPRGEVEYRIVAIALTESALGG